MITATLTLTPWAAQALSLQEERDIARRAVDLHCRVQIGMSNRGWGIRVNSWRQSPAPTFGPAYRVDHHHRHGHLADLVFKALDEYERLYVFTRDELAVIQGQTHA